MGRWTCQITRQPVHVNVIKSPSPTKHHADQSLHQENIKSSQDTAHKRTQSISKSQSSSRQAECIPLEVSLPSLPTLIGPIKCRQITQKMTINSFIPEGVGMIFFLSSSGFLFFFFTPDCSRAMLRRDVPIRYPHEDLIHADGVLAKLDPGPQKIGPFFLVLVHWEEGADGSGWPRPPGGYFPYQWLEYSAASRAPLQDWDWGLYAE